MRKGGCLAVRAVSRDWIFTIERVESWGRHMEGELSGEGRPSRGSRVFWKEAGAAGRR